MQNSFKNSKRNGFLSLLHCFKVDQLQPGSLLLPIICLSTFWKLPLHFLRYRLIIPVMRQLEHQGISFVTYFAQPQILVGFVAMFFNFFNLSWNSCFLSWGHRTTHVCSIAAILKSRSLKSTQDCPWKQMPFLSFQSPHRAAAQKELHTNFFYYLTTTVQ